MQNSTFRIVLFGLLLASSVSVTPPFPSSVLYVPPASPPTKSSPTLSPANLPLLFMHYIVRSIFYAIIPLTPPPLAMRDYAPTPPPLARGRKLKKKLAASKAEVALERIREVKGDRSYFKWEGVKWPTDPLPPLSTGPNHPEITTSLGVSFKKSRQPPSSAPLRPPSTPKPTPLPRPRRKKSPLPQRAQPTTRDYILGAYPRDAVGVGEAGSRRGLKDRARKYGYRYKPAKDE